MSGSRAYQVQVRVDGQLDRTPWSGWIDGLVVVPEPDGTTVLTGRLRDQAELLGLLAAIRDIGISIVSIETTPITPTSEGDQR